VLSALLADPLTGEIPVVIVSADASPVQAKRLRAAGAAGYLTKPFDIDQLLAAVRSGGTPPFAPDPVDAVDGVLDRSTVGLLHVLAANPAVGSAQIGEMLATFRHDADGMLVGVHEAIAEGPGGRGPRSAQTLRGRRHRRLRPLPHDLQGTRISRERGTRCGSAGAGPPAR
jgi:hypothetical protein